MGRMIRLCFAFIAIAALGLGSLAQAASINYGNFGPVAPGINFLGVTESSITDPVPLYGPPSPFVIGLDFNPISFGSVASGGGSDITDGQLNLTISGKTANTLVEITDIQIFEQGDFTLTGVGTAATTAYAGVIMYATVTEVNGLPVAPINLAPISDSFSNGLPPPVITSPWSLGLSLDVQAQVPGATRVELVINNTLATSSEAATAASIAKKDFMLGVTNGFVIVIPEPTTFAFAGAAIGLLVLRRRRA